ncbi:hypothetical protein B0H14DRAFT_3858564 [Mycena olivaceomarginata]|nr:hypothetical protein B0H14DRAFT_3858564 [Mycena olivaceomarginata]
MTSRTSGRSTCTMQNGHIGVFCKGGGGRRKLKTRVCSKTRTQKSVRCGREAKTIRKMKSIRVRRARTANSPNHNMNMYSASAHLKTRLRACLRLSRGLSPPAEMLGHKNRVRTTEPARPPRPTKSVQDLHNSATIIQIPTGPPRPGPRRGLRALVTKILCPSVRTAPAHLWVLQRIPELQVPAAKILLPEVRRIPAHLRCPLHRPGHPPPCAQPAKQPNTRPQLAPCVLCGYHPPVPAHETALLQKCFLHRAELLLPLAAAGVVADTHLRVLLRLRERSRKEFLHSLARVDKITYVEKADILDALETFLDTNPDVTSSPERARKVRLASIRRPPKGVENVLATHTCKYGYVKRHMQVADDEEYFELVDLVERQIPWYLDASVPIEEQDEEQLDTLITMICEEKPGLRKYDDLWPVYLHIRRFPQGNLTAPNAPPQHECPQLAKYPTSDVPASITALLEDYEMQELGPAFLSLGFNSEAAFTNNLTSQRKKDCIIEKLVERFPHCSQFQLLMLRYIVERV